jgi:hypothetical protein
MIPLSGTKSERKVTKASFSESVKSSRPFLIRFIKDFCAIFTGENRRVTVVNSRNPIASEEITLSLNSQTVWYLDRLIEKGLYGNKRAEAAKVIIYDHCKLLIGEGKLTEAPSIPGSSALTINEA